MDSMRNVAWLCVLGAGCATQAEPSIQLECAEHTSCQGALGVGGVIYYTLFDGDGIASTSHLIARDDGVVRIETQDDGAKIVGVTPGTTEIAMLDDSDTIVLRQSITVGEVSQLALRSVSISGTYEVPADQPLPITLDPQVADERSIGTHFYEVSLDGSDYTCWGVDIRYCTGPVWYDSLPLDPLSAGEHTLAFHSLDGGRDWSFTLTAR
jgi:hypothetical protein